MNDHEFLTVPEAAELLRISRNLTYELVAEKVLPSIRLGRRVVVPRVPARPVDQAGGRDSRVGVTGAPE